MQSSQLSIVYRSILVGIPFDILGEPFGEFVVRVEEGRHDKVEQRPKLVHRVLDRSTSEKESVAALEAKKSLPSCRG